jgi:hypothetical protein
LRIIELSKNLKSEINNLRTLPTAMIGPQENADCDKQHSNVRPKAPYWVAHSWHADSALLSVPTWSLRMTLAFRFCRVLLIGYGIAVILSGAARSQDNPSDSARDSIIQSVRDDVRRKIRDRQSAQHRAESGTVGRASPRVYRQRKAKKPTN